MHKNAPLLGKAAALAAAATLGLSGLAFGSAAIAAPLSSVSQDAGTQSADAAALPDGLKDAIIRDLGITPEEYAANTDAASALSALKPQFAALDGFVSLSLEDGKGVVNVSSDSPQLDALAATVSASVKVDSDDSAKPAAPVEGDGYVSLVKQLLGAPGVFSVGQGADGKVVVHATEAAAASTGGERSFAKSGSDSLAQIAGAYSNIEINGDIADSGLEAQSANDTVGGAGYATAITDSSAELCSIGFTAWTPAGAPAVISAGHCTDDGANHATVLTAPKNEDAYNVATPSLLAPLGDFGFSQYGPTLQTSGTDPSTNDTDISVIDVSNNALNLLPKVAKWDAPGTNELAATGINVVNLGAPVVGAPVCKSGRTTGWSCSTISEVNGWAVISGRYVYGFGSELASDHGDSGGAIVSGSTAVGLISGGDGTFTWGTDLSNALPKTSGYTLRVAVAAPTLTSPADGADVAQGSAITGTAPAGSIVTVAPQGGAPFDVTTGGDGKWTFLAPTAFGDYPFTVTAAIGFNKSTTENFSVTVVPSAPVITAPANGAKLTDSVTAIAGTGVVGAKVTLTGDVTGTATVGEDGKWTIPVDPALKDYDNYTVSATQLIEAQTSQAGTSAFSIVPVAPAITDPAAGASYGAGQAPVAVSGTGIDGAVVTVVVDGVAQTTTATVANGKWTVILSGTIASGSHVIEAYQTIDGIGSNAASVTFTVAAAEVAGGPGTETPADPAGATPSGQLANTGATVLPIVASGIVLLGGGALLLLRRRQSKLN